MNPPTLSVVIVARDEETRIGECLASVRTADEVVLVDDGSRDATREIAALAGARVIPGSGTLGALREQGRASATGEWILSLDADERVPPDGLGRLKAVLAEVSPSTAGLALPIRTYLGGVFLHAGGYFPARRVRVFRREGARWPVEAVVHERVQLRGRAERCDAVALEHFSFRDLADARQKQLRYAAMAASELRARRRRPSLPSGAFRAGWRFLRVLVLRGGWRMGRLGWALAVIQAEGVWVRTRLARRNVGDPR